MIRFLAFDIPASNCNPELPGKIQYQMSLHQYLDLACLESQLQNS